jgi:hypothetical protein
MATDGTPVPKRKRLPGERRCEPATIVALADDRV